MKVICILCEERMVLIDDDEQYGRPYFYCVNCDNKIEIINEEADS